ncbi:MAG: bactofilin family protein [Actinomycetota bacterium]
MTETLILGGAFLGLLLLPFLPGVIELKRPRDDEPLPVVHDNAKDPRFFATAFKRMLVPLLDQTNELPAVVEIQLRRRERLEIHDELLVPSKERRRGIMAAKSNAVIEQAAELDEVYAAKNVRIESGSRVRALACEGKLLVEQGCKIGRWIDAEKAATIGRNCDLGVSASSGGRLRLDVGCTFQRLWGLPITTSPAVIEHDAVRPLAQAADAGLQDSVVWGRGWLSIPSGMTVSRDIVVYGDLEVGAGCVIRGSIKAHGKVNLGEGARVEGNLISRKAVTVGGRARVHGNLFAEGDVTVSTGATIGRPGRFKGLYTSTTVSLQPGVTVYGWVVAERGGKVQ